MRSGRRLPPASECVSQTSRLDDSGLRRRRFFSTIGRRSAVAARVAAPRRRRSARLGRCAAGHVGERNCDRSAASLHIAGAGGGTGSRVVGGCGGAQRGLWSRTGDRGDSRPGWGGASVFAVALAQTADEALLIDLDPFGGGIDLLVGSESATGLRWPDLSVLGGRLNWTAVRDAPPRQHRVSVLSAARHPCEIDPEPVGAIVDAGRRGGATVVCDVPRRMDDTTACALDRADLVVAITTSDVRGWPR